jgi:Domain of unknown function (DUF6602)
MTWYNWNHFMDKHEKTSAFDPSLSQFYDAEQDRLASMVRAIRASISHGGEKGRTVEAEVKSILRDFLPAEYGISTGSIAYHDDACLRRNTYDQSRDRIRLSEQIDVIIYDALHCGPLVHLATCDVFPLEAVYAYVEVKTSTSSPRDLDNLLSQSNRLRSLKPRLFWRTIVEDPTGTQLAFIPLESVISVRSFAFVLDGEKLGGPKDILRKLQDLSDKHKGRDTFLSGLYISGKGFYCTRPVSRSDDPRKGQIIADLQRPLLAFKNSLLSALSRYPRIPQGITPAINLYTPLREKVNKSKRLGA